MKNKYIKIAVLLVAIFFIITATSGQTAFADSDKVWIGGAPIGVDLKIDGVMIVGIADILTEDGLKSPAKEADIEVGDIIKKINGKDISKSSDLAQSTRASYKELIIELDRGGKKIFTYIKPTTESSTGERKLGLVVKDNIQGIGTLTFIQDNKTFGALGHPASSQKAQNPTPILGGQTKNCIIMGVTKGIKGKAGELKGVFVENNKMTGSVLKNDIFGIFGKLDKAYVSPIYNYPMEVGEMKDIKTGHATILSTIDGNKVEEYDIEILSKQMTNAKDNKGIVIKITDPKLIQTTGGIVQGMSGSPIIQNGKIIGAVTHVFVNDPTKGYGIFIENMLESANSIA